MTDEITPGLAKSAAALLPTVYDELRRMAAAQMAREKPGQTLNPTALVHEAYQRLIGPHDAEKWANKRHFLAAAAEAMRRILVESARRKKSLKRGGEALRHDILDTPVANPEMDDTLLDLHDALDQLAEKDSEKAELVKLRYFTGLTIEQTAEVMGISVSTANRHWVFARAWLYDHISEKN